MNDLIIVRGGGDLATGTIHRLWRAGFRVLVLEAERPAAVRRQVSVCEALYEGSVTVEDLTARRVHSLSELDQVWAAGAVPVLADPEGECIKVLKPAVLVDAILAKKNLGTTRDMAPLTIALGPGFVAGADVDVVIETCRGHTLGRIITAGAAKPNTGIPGLVGGYQKERVLYSPAAGVFHSDCQIGDVVAAGQVIGWVETPGGSLEIRGAIGGVLRGLLRQGYPVTEGFKVADIDPRIQELENCWTISDKSRCIAGSVLEQVCAEVVRSRKQKD